MSKYSQPVQFSGQKRRAGPAPDQAEQEQKQYAPIDWSKPPYCDINVLEAIAQHTPARLYGKEGVKPWRGACIFEGCDADNTGFIVWPYGTSKYGVLRHFYCRKCRRAGDIISLLRQYHGWGSQETLEKLEVRDERKLSAYQARLEASRKKQLELEAFYQKQLELLRHIYPKMQRALKHDAARLYLESRGIAIDQAQRYGLGYLPVPENVQEDDSLRGWYGRLIFPLSSPKVDELTFAGRTLALWQSGMSPEQHKLAIDEYNAKFEPGDKRRIVRVMKTSPCGHFGYREAIASGERLVIPEGEFDALSLLLSGVTGVVAMGIGFSARLIPVSVELVILAQDADSSGRRAAQDLAHELARAGLETCQIIPTVGKDWNDMYVQAGAQAIRELFSICSLCPNEVEYYDDAGTPYCATCWPGSYETGEDEQQSIEQVAPEREEQSVPAPLVTREDAINMVVRVFGPCAIEEQALGYTLAQHVQRLQGEHCAKRRHAQTQCMFEELHEKRISDKAFSRHKKRCIQKALGNGWCSSHQHCETFLELGAQLYYPELSLRTHVGLLAGAANWEAYAQSVTGERLERDIALLQRMIQAGWRAERQEALLSNW